MKDDLLLDTHAFLWFWWDDPQLSATAKTAICDPTKRKLISTASAWEVAIKVSLKKLDLGAPYRGFIHQHMVRNNFEWLQITDEHLAGVVDLPFRHKDPFDRMLVAQALYENIPIVSADVQHDAYGISRIW
jgi:PIN domain nuclease of toxin-antitoxin system